MRQARKSRRTPPKRTILGAIRAASAAFTGQARLLEDQPVAASETTFRGPGHRLTVEIRPQQPLFGDLPEDELRLQGDTELPPGQRQAYGQSMFPPDSLRQEQYCDYAQAGLEQPVLVILAEPAAIYPLTGPGDTLPEAVQRIRRWTELDQSDQPEAVLADLAQDQRDPVAYVAGFELLLASADDRPGLVEEFLDLPNRPGAATQGILNQLYMVAASLSDSEIKALARRLVQAMSQESDPAALLGYLTWFDAHQRAWRDEEDMRTAVVEQARRAETTNFSGLQASAWQQRVKQQAASVLSRAGD